jgi:tRNA pseudouridine38-40 synthase
LDLDYLNLLSSLLVGRHDFQSFQSSGTKVPHTTREISHFAWCHGAGDSIICEITGTGFLKQMVRNLIGTLVDLHFAKAPPERLLAILDAKDRRKALSTAPACGLHLYRVYYPQELDNKCRKL